MWNIVLRRMVLVEILFPGGETHPTQDSGKEWCTEIGQMTYGLFTVERMRLSACGGRKP